MSNNWFWIISFWISNISRIWNSILISYICVHMFLGIVIVYVIQISVLHTIMKSTSENLVGDSWIFSIILLTILLLRRHCCTETLKVYKKPIWNGLIFHGEPRYYSANLIAYTIHVQNLFRYYTFEWFFWIR